MRRLLLSLVVVLSTYGCGDDDGPECSSDTDCAPDGACIEGACVPLACMDGATGGDETDVDCGGSCAACAEGQGCLEFTDCESGICAAGLCTGPTCFDGRMNGDESDDDCGGGCDPCNNGDMCNDPADCESGACTMGTCTAMPTCDDGLLNLDETDVDCGGSCDACVNGEMCNLPADCLNGACTMGACADPACDDGAQNGDETDVDCGGSCGGCDVGEVCGGNPDCTSGLCQGDVCLAAGCGNSLRDGDETDVDCGGACGPCGDGLVCAIAGDCQSGVCDTELCAAPACDDGVLNGDETDSDCGGSCSPCARGLACIGDADCATDGCRDDLCVIGPTAAFDVTPTTGEPPLMVTVTSTATAGDAVITLVEYDFGDGFAALTSHSFTSAATYPVVQRVTDASGFIDMAMQNVIVRDAPTGCFLSPTDKSPDVDLEITADGLAVEMWTISAVGVRSECSIAPGSGVYYFEGSIAPWECDPTETPEGCVITPYELLNIGIATSSVAFSSFPGEDDQGFSLDTGGSYWYDGAFLGNVDRFSTDTYGYVVDYRGANPIAHLITDNYGSPDITHTQTLTGVTTDVFVMLTGGRRKVGVDAQFNFGNDTTNRPFRFDADAVLRANALGSVADALVLGFGATSALPLNTRPTLTVSGDMSVALGSPVTITATAADAEDGTLTASIQWEDLATVYGFRTTGSGASMTFTPTQLGSHPMRATVFDSNGGRRQAIVMVNVTGALPQFDPVELVTSSVTDPNVGSGMTLSGDNLSVHWVIADKMGLRGNQGNLDQFWYFEITRLGGPVNQGGGLVIWEGDLNAYSADNVPPSYSINTSGGAWQNIIFHTSYDTTNTTYGFAVDYRGLNPMVYLVIGGAVVDEWLMYDVFVPVHPMLYGNFTGEAGAFDERVNFGATAFVQNPCSALTSYGIGAGDVSALELGWGDANTATSCP